MPGATVVAVVPRMEEQIGKLVALEGDADIVSTQLRLLPPSQKILVIPSILESRYVEKKKGAFDARAFVRHVHTAFVERTQTARSFLQSSTSSQPRLVFMNGGTISARAACIARICENITNGNISEAETIFNEIVRNGVAGLMKSENVINQERAQMEGVGAEGDEEKLEERNEDPTVKAMKAGDSLDREIEALEPNDNSHGHGKFHTGSQAKDIGTARSIWQATKDQTKGEAEKVGEATDMENEIFTTSHGDEIIRTVLTMPNRNTTRKEKRGTFGPHWDASRTPYASTLEQQSHNIDADDDEVLDLVRDESFVSLPPTPGVVVLGEACLVDMQSASPEKSVRRAQSFDKFYPSNSKYLETPVSRKALKHTTSSAFDLRRSKTTESPKTRSAEFLQTLPRTTFVRASETTIRKSSTSNGSMRSSLSTTTMQRPLEFVHRGIDAGQFEARTQSENEREDEPFEPVFPLVEDIIFHWNDSSRNEIFEAVMNSYKNRSYPIFPVSEVASSPTAVEEYDPPISPRSILSHPDDRYEVSPTSHSKAETDDLGYSRRHEFDPYAAYDGYPPDIQRQWPARHKSVGIDSSVSSTNPPTPVMTPPPSSNGAAEKFFEFSPINASNAIDVQNSLRQMLSLHFPASDTGYSQYAYPVAPEADRLWKPVFRIDETASIGNEGRTVDQIIALGSEEGVKKDFFAQISGQMERLGTKRDGMSRSAKLDIR